MYCIWRNSLDTIWLRSLLAGSLRGQDPASLDPAKDSAKYCELVPIYSVPKEWWHSVLSLHIFRETHGLPHVVNSAFPHCSSSGKIYTPVRCILPLWKGETSVHVTAWWSSSTVLPTFPLWLLIAVTMFSPEIFCAPPLKIVIFTEDRLLFLVSSATPPLCLCPLYAFCGRLVSGSDIAWKSHPLLIILSGRNCVLSWCSVKIV